MNLSDTIVAVGSPPGASARGMVRISGPETWATLSAMSAPDAPLDRSRGLRAHRLLNGWPCLLLAFPGPGSYTGEDTIELVCSGNLAVLSRVVSIALDAGARAAEPGEFTARAWFNGRLTLTQAEGVAALIGAASDAQLRAAHSLSGNRLGRVATDLCEQVAATLALVEAGIDFTDEEDVVAIAPADLARHLTSMIRSVNETLEHAVGSESLSALPRVVLVGPPNAGKSTLYNALLGRRRAVVSDARGTTRDVLVEPMHLDPADPLSPEVLLVDVAGLDESPAGLNPQMQAAARDAMAQADLLIELSAADADERAPQAATVGSGVPRLMVRSKADLEVHASGGVQAVDVVRVSAHTGAGLAGLRKAIGEALAGRVASLGAESLALLPRHESCLRDAASALETALALVAPQADERALRDLELVAASMRSALDALGALAGAVSPDDVLGRIFAGFCIGK